MRSKRTLLLFGLIFIVGMPLFGQESSGSRVVIETARPAVKIAKEFPYDIQLINADGESFNSSKLFKKDAKATVLLFWMTSCFPCRMELDAISKKFEQWKKQLDFEFYAISTDFSDRQDLFNKRVKESNWPFPAYFDINREFIYAMDGGLNGLPQLFLLNKKGQVIYHTRKFIPGDENQLFEALKAI